MAGYEDVLVTGRMQHRIPLIVGRDPEVTTARSNRFQVLGGEVVVVKIDDHEWFPETVRRQTRLTLRGSWLTSPHEVDG